MFPRALRIAACLGVMLTLVAVPVRADGPYTDALGRYTYAPLDGFALDVKGSTGGYAIFATPAQKAWVEVYSYLRSSPSLDETVKSFVTARKNDTTNQVLFEQPQPTTMDGQPALYIDYLRIQEEGRPHVRAVFAVNGNVVGRVDVVAEEAAWEAFVQQAGAALTGFHFLTNTYPTVFTDPQQKFSFTVPLGWQRDISRSVINASDSSRNAFIGTNASTRVYIETYPIQQGITLDQHVANAISNLLESTPTIETDQKTARPSTVGGVAALQWELFSTNENVRYHSQFIHGLFILGAGGRPL